MGRLIKVMNRIIFITVIVVILIAVASILPEEKLSQNIRIGVSDDISGFVVDSMISDDKLDIRDNLEAYFIKDC